MTYRKGRQTMNMRPTNLTPINPSRFDAMTRGPEKLWGLTSIASFLGLSVDSARRLHKMDLAPIYRPDGRRYFAFRSELSAWLRTTSGRGNKP